MSRKGQYEDGLSQIVRLIKAKPCTAGDLAERLDLSKAAIYLRIQVLRRRGVKILRKRVREGKRGPLSRVYGVGT